MKRVKLKPSPPKKKAEMGRPTKYDQKFAVQALKICEIGGVDFELARFFNVGLRTIQRWRTQFPDFAEALKAGKAKADNRVERSLYHKAVGYDYVTEEAKVVAGSIEKVQVRKHIPPSDIACIFWLKNRRPDLWRDQQDHQHLHVSTKDVKSSREQISSRISGIAERIQAGPDSSKLN